MVTPPIQQLAAIMNLPKQNETEPAPWTPEFTGVESPVSCIDCNCPLGFAMVAGFKIACCEQCHGMLIQRDTLGPVVNRCRGAWRKLDSKVQPLDPSELERRTTCPVCSDMMETHPYIGPGCIVIDACAECDLVWLNGGELDRVVQAPGKRDYHENDLERTEISFVKPVVNSPNEITNIPSLPEDRVASTLLDLISLLGM